MKVKKVVKRLDKVVAMLSDVIKQYSSSDRQVRNVLGIAKASVARARAAVHTSTRTAKKTGVTPKPTKQKRVTAAARKESSASATKRRAAAKGKGVHSRKKVAAKSSLLLRTARKSSRAVKKTEPERLKAAVGKELSPRANKRHAAAKSRAVHAGRNRATSVAGKSRSASAGELSVNPPAPSEMVEDRGENLVPNSTESSETTSRS